MVIRGVAGGNADETDSDTVFDGAGAGPMGARGRHRTTSGASRLVPRCLVLHVSRQLWVRCTQMGRTHARHVWACTLWRGRGGIGVEVELDGNGRSFSLKLLPWYGMVWYGMRYEA